MRDPSPRRNGTAAGLRRTCLETGFTLLPIGLTLLMAGLLLWLMGVDPLAYYGFILRKWLLAPSGWQASLTRMGPLLLIAASLMVAFSAGLWNLGGDGQFMLGAVLASAIAPALLSHGVPLSITLLLALLAGALAGVLWGLLPAALKIWRNINDIITSLMMFFLGVSLANVLVKLLLADPATTVPQTRNLPWEQRLPMLFGGQVSSGLLLGLLAVLLTHAVINHTAFGLRIRVMGANPRAAIHAGLPVGALTLAVFALSAGLAGAVEIIGIQGNVRADWNPAYSLVVVPLVFLAQFNGFGSIALVFVFSVLSIGSESAARRMGVPNHFTLLTVALLLIMPGLTRLAVARLRQALRHRASNAGLALQAAGDKPAALDAAGVSVQGTRTLAVLTTGALAGLGGAYMVQIGAGIFVPFMTQGNGFIAIVLAMLARGRPLWVLAGALLFGTCLSLTTALQVLGVNLPTDVIQMLPFITVMLVLVVFGRRAALPAALGTLWTRGTR